MKNRIILALLLLNVAALSAQVRWKVKEDAAEVRFKIKNFGVWVEGTFGGLKADIVFEPSTADGTISATIDAGTINTGIESRDKHLRSADYFETETYPGIALQSSRLEKSANQYTFTGKLTIKSVGKAISFPFVFGEVDGKGVFRAEFEINRTDYGVGSGGGPMGETVKIILSVPVTRQ